MIAILYNIRSLHNVGSIFRTADAAGFEKIYLCGITPSPIDKFGREEKSITKVSLGAEKYLEWEKIGNSPNPKKTINLILNLKSNGYKIFCLEQDKKSKEYFKAKIPKNKKIALIVGNEIKGIPRSILNICDEILEIPMYGKKESLNVAVAFGIVAFQIKNAGK